MANPFLYSAPTFDYYPSKEHVPWQSLWFESSEMFLPETEFFPIIDQPLEYLSIPSVDAYAMGQPSEPYTGYHDSKYHQFQTVCPSDINITVTGLVDYTPNDTYDGDYGALDPVRNLIVYHTKAWRGCSIMNQNHPGSQIIVHAKAWTKF